MRIAMIGTGYVGFVSGACFADFGHQVCCIDKDEAKIDGLNAGKMPIWEPGLEALVKAKPSADAYVHERPERRREGCGGGVHCGGNSCAPWRRPCRSHFRVPGNSRVGEGDGSGHGRRDQVDRSRWNRRRDREDPAGGRITDASVASNPEFLREGAAIADFKHPDRIVVGAEDERAQEVLKEIYRPLFLNRAPILITGRRTAELTKYAANAFLAGKISFINEIADLCEAVDADVQDVARGIGLDNRIGPKFLHAGAGYGGSCFPKDTLALLQTADKAGIDQRIVRTTVEVNDERKAGMADRVARAIGADLNGKRVGVLGLAFKPNTDDMREAPSIPLINGLLEKGAEVSAFDPIAREQAEKVFNGITFASDAYHAAEDADALGDRHRVGRVQGPRPRQACGRDARQGARRSAEYLWSRRGGGSRADLLRRGPRQALTD